MRRLEALLVDALVSREKFIAGVKRALLELAEELSDSVSAGFTLHMFLSK